MDLNRSRNKNDLAEEESFDSNPGVRCVCTFQSLQGCLSVLCKKKKNHQKVISVVVCILVVKVKLFLHLFQINFIFFSFPNRTCLSFCPERVLCRQKVAEHLLECSEYYCRLNYTRLAVGRYSEPGCIDSG